MKGPSIYYEIDHMYGSILNNIRTSAELKTSILEDIDLGFSIEIDFKNVNTMSKQWARICFGSIIKEKGESFFRDNILISNANQKIINIINKLISKDSNFRILT